jgi:antagonist of KipI
MIKILNPGILSSFQDLGRKGFRETGIPLSGAMDLQSHSLANWLVGNDEYEATIEFAYHGAVIEFLENAEISICGNGSKILENENEIDFYRSYFIPKDTVLKFHPSSTGTWSYLAMKNGFNTEKILGSKSVYAKAGIGHLIQRNEILYFNNSFSKKENEISALNSLPGKLFQTDNAAIRIIPGNEFELLTKESQQTFFNNEFQILPSSDRMGYRLKGENLFLKNKTVMLSSAVSPGTIQLTPDGQLIVLMRDAQTTGGYPRVGKIIEQDISNFAQRRPNEKIVFTAVSISEGEDLFLEKERYLQEIKMNLQKAKK